MSLVGYVVLAIEHRDGSGQSVHIRSAHGKIRPLTYAPIRDAQYVLSHGNHELLNAFRSWGNDKPDGQYPFRTEQLVFRTKEIYETYHSFRVLVCGDTSNIRSEIRNSKHDLSQWKDQVDVENTWLVGHSFGGSTVVSMLSQEFFVLYADETPTCR